MTVPTTLPHLPQYPSSKAIQDLPPSQRTALYSNVASILSQSLALSDEQLASSPRFLDFIASYVDNAANDALNGLIYEQGGDARLTQAEKIIRKRVLLLAKRLASLPKHLSGLKNALTPPILLSLAIAFAKRNITSTREVFSAAFQNASTPISDAALSAFKHVLRDSHTAGLNALRKTTHTMLAFLKSLPAEGIKVFATDKDFVLALAKCYGEGLDRIASNYGGMHLQHLQQSVGSGDGWELMWIRCKIELMDSFHLIMTNLASSPVPPTHANYVFDVILSLLDLVHDNSSTLLPDYQQAYSFSSTLLSRFTNAGDDRVAVLGAQLREFDDNAGDGTPLKLLIKSSGMAPGLASRGTRSVAETSKGKGRGQENNPTVEDDISLTADVAQIMDIFPEISLSRARSLLKDSRFGGDAGRVIAAILEGEVSMADDEPGPIEIKSLSGSSKPRNDPAKERRNVFDEQRMDLSSVVIGKRDESVDSLLKPAATSSTYASEMKADILRRVEAMALADLDEEEEDIAHGKGKGKTRIVAFEDELDDGEIRVQDSDDEEAEKTAEDLLDASELGKMTESAREKILIQTYLSTPGVFGRGADTKRSKTRAELRERTGWADEQIEGWATMLERNPNKDKILQKYEWTGNRAPHDSGEEDESETGQTTGEPSRPSSAQSGRARGGGHTRGFGGRGQDRGRGRGRGGRGRGGGGGHGGGPSQGGGDQRDRASKDRNKARHANHDRKRGRDKKMARGGAIVTGD